MSNNMETTYTCTVSLTWESDQNAEVADAVASKYSCAAPGSRGQHTFEVPFDPYNAEGNLKPEALKAAADALRALLRTRHSVVIRPHHEDDDPTCVFVNGQYRLCHNHTLVIDGEAAEVELSSESIAINAYLCSIVPYCKVTIPNTFIP